MTKKIAVILAGLSMATYGIAQDNNVIVTISSKVCIDKNLEEEFLKEAKEDSKVLSKKWADFRGVAEVETIVNREETDSSTQDAMRCSECGGKKQNEQTQSSVEETKCPCGKPKQTKGCSSCGQSKPCSSCSSCCGK